MGPHALCEHKQNKRWAEETGKEKKKRGSLKKQENAGKGLLKWHGPDLPSVHVGTGVNSTKPDCTVLHHDSSMSFEMTAACQAGCTAATSCGLSLQQTVNRFW